MVERERVDQDSWKRGLYRKEAKLEECFRAKCSAL